MEWIPLTIDKLVSTETGTGAFLMILKEKGKRHRILPIVIGPFEAQAIIFGMEKNIETPRPLTHDLFYNVLRTLGYKLGKVVINKFSEGVFYARLILEKDGQIMEFDSRPSDAVALAVRFGAPIFTTEEVLDKTGVEPEKLDRMEAPEEPGFTEQSEEDDEADDASISDFSEEVERLLKELDSLTDGENGQMFNINLNDEEAKELAESFFKMMDSLLSHLPKAQQKKKMPNEEELTRMMNEAIANEDYERAAQLRDALNMLRKMKNNKPDDSEEK